MTNRYVLIGSIFAVWMLIFDNSSWLVHRELNREIEEVDQAIDYYEDEIEKDRQTLHDLDSVPGTLERIAREEHLMKRENEDVFIIKEEENED
jgi:cell division protein FtsB